MNLITRMGAWIRGHYDRLLAAVTLVVFLSILGWCVIQSAVLKSGQEAFTGWLNGMTPKHPVAAASDVARYAAAETGLMQPEPAGVWSNALFVPETRCWCVDCLRPISLDEEV